MPGNRSKNQRGGHEALKGDHGIEAVWVGRCVKFQVELRKDGG